MTFSVSVALLGNETMNGDHWDVDADDKNIVVCSVALPLNVVLQVFNLCIHRELTKRRRRQRTFGITRAMIREKEEKPP